MLLVDAPVCGSQDALLHSGPSDVASPHTDTPIRKALL